MSYLCFVRRSIVGILLSLSLVACEKAEIKLSEIGSIPISDAAYIFQREGNRSESDDEDLSGVWKVTLSGDEVKLKVLDTEGNEIDIEIYSVENILENYLIVDTTVGRVLVDKTTNKVYDCPGTLSLNHIGRIEEYPRGTIYYTAGQLFKATISSQSITEEQLLPEGQGASDFFLGQKGSLYYNNSLCYDQGGKIMTENKSLYPIEYENTNECMVFGTADLGIYTIDPMWYDRNDEDEKEDESGSRSSTDGPNGTQHPIYRWNTISNNKINKEFVCNISYFPVIFAPINKVRNNNVIFFVRHHNNSWDIYEFNGSNCTLKKYYTTSEEGEAMEIFLTEMMTNGKNGLPPKSINSRCVCFGESHRNGEGYVVNFDPKTYEITKYPYNISSKEYEVYGTKYEPSWGKMLFTALRYSDGSIIMGEVDDKGNVKIISERASTYHITEYFALN